MENSGHTQHPTLQELGLKIRRIMAWALPFLFGSCCKTTLYSLAAGQYCSGTGKGNTRFYRLCDEIWLLLPLALDFLVVSALAMLFETRIRSIKWRLVLLGLYAVYILVSPCILVKVWDSPFFLTSYR